MAQKDIKLTAAGAYNGDGTESNNERRPEWETRRIWSPDTT